LALSVATLIEGLETSVVQGVSLENDQEAILSFNANGDLEVHGGFDDQLTDDDANSETDPEPEHDNDNFVELAETQPRDVDENFEESDGF
jgi:hypothetical protein